MEATYWKKCSTCKKPLPFGEPYQACSVSTCNHSRTGLQFCSVSCWSAHVPILRHRESWALEKMAPSIDEARKTELASESVEAASPRRIIPSSPAASAASSLSASSDDEVLVVASKLKAYIRERSEMNMSADVLEALSKKLRQLADEAIVRARNDGRKTVMARDF